MRVFLSLLLSCFLFLTSCITPLTGPQRCALMGEFYEGSNVASQLHIYSDSEGGVQSYNSPVHNPRCKRPASAEEKKEVQEIYPKALAIRKKNRKNTIIGAVVIAAGAVIIAAVYGLVDLINDPF